MSRGVDTFQTIKTEGAILPADLLRRIIHGDPDVPGLGPQDYHLAKAERLNEVATRAWNRLQGAWESFKESMESLPEFDAGTSLTRERWLMILFQELGYGRLTTRKASEIEGKSYPISHEWQNTPIHLVSFRLDLDKRTPGKAGAARVSPHSLVQEFLNRSDDHLWGLLSNGLTLRLLRDNVYLTRQAYVEFDLQAMMSLEAYSDFFLLFLLCHQSRVEVPEGKAPEHCWLEKWYDTAARMGVRALDQLRNGVQRAIEALGGGFLAHPSNSGLRDRLRSGTLSTQDFYRQVLRQVYRLLFLFVAEDRELLLDPDAPPKVKKVYIDYYSTRRLRELAARTRGTRHPDLWRALGLVLAKLHAGCPELALPPLGSFLFAPESTADLNDADIANTEILKAVRALAFTVDRNVLRPINYRNLGPEELGSVYESLLEMHPLIQIDATNPDDRFRLDVAAGSERKTTGSYYTPTSLVNCLLDSALDPVIEDRLKNARRLANGEWRTEEEKAYADSVISGTGGMAAGYGYSRTSLSPDSQIPQNGDVRPDQSDSALSRLDPGQYSRGMGTAGQSGIPAIPQDCARQPQGIGDPSAPEPASGDLHGKLGSAPSRRADHSRQTDSQPQPLASKAGEVANGEQRNENEESPSITPRLPIAAHHSPFSSIPLAIRHSLLAETALLSLKVCDPACGSGHFLIAAAHRMARRLAAIRAGEEEPSPLNYQNALRDAIGHCIYGVDINPMSVELCKISLWMEALEPGKPLSFLDHKIRCGNSLLGTTPALMRNGIPDDAFKPILGDDKKVCKDLKKRNKAEHSGQQTLFTSGNEPWEQLGNLSAAIAGLESIPDDTIHGIRKKQEAYKRLVKSQNYLFGHLLADAWCAAFVWEKVDKPDFPYYITEAIFRRLERDPRSETIEVHREIQRLARQYQFFHWHLEFPDVFRVPGKDETPENELTGWIGGFDVVLGNPPWERIKLQEKEWFAERSPDIANAPNAAARRKLIAELKETDPPLFQAFQDDKRRAEGDSHLVRNSGRYPLCGRGDINTYTIFAELKRSLINPTGRVGCIVPSGIATDDTTKFFFQDLMDNKSIASFYDFENKGVFPGVHSSYKFCLLTLTGPARPAKVGAEFVFFAHDVADLADSWRRFTLTAHEIALLNPNTRTCPIFRSQKDAELTKAIYRRVPVLIKEGPPEENSWGISFMAMFHMSNDSHLFRIRDELEQDGWVLKGNVFHKDGEKYLPLYEAKMIHHFDHRFGDYADLPEDSKSTQLPDVPIQRLMDPSYAPLPRYWVPKREVNERLHDRWEHQWLLGWRDICRSTDERTVIASVAPLTGCGDTLLLMLPKDPHKILGALCSCLDSSIADYAARQKVGGTHLKFHVFKQISIVTPKMLEAKHLWHEENNIANWLLPRVIELTYTAWDLEPFALDCGYDGPPFRWDVERRFLLRCELDAAFFHLYLGTQQEWEQNSTPELLGHFPTPRHAVDYIMDTFPIVKRKDEKAFGAFRTKETILSIYNEMAGVMAANAAAEAKGLEPSAQYQTRLDPLPGPPMDADGHFIPMSQWPSAAWPEHIHPPGEKRTVCLDILDRRRDADDKDRN